VSKGPEYVCRWIETHCVLTSGSMAGKPLRLLGCQRDVIGGSGTDQHWILRSEDEEDAVPEDPKWSPDGRRIAFEWRGGLYTLPTNARLRPSSSFTNRLSSNSALIAGATRSPGTRASTGSPLSSAGRKRQTAVPAQDPPSSDGKDSPALAARATLHLIGGVREPDVSPAKRCRLCGETKPREAFGA
jgi:hypothetical protein